MYLINDGDAETIFFACELSLTIKRKYIIYSTRRVSELTFISYAHSQTI
jgi:hypothetical protein